MSIFVIALFSAFAFQAQAQAPAPAAAAQAKPALDPDKLAIDWVDRMNELSNWYITVDGKEDDVKRVVDKVMEMYAPDAIVEVPPHDQTQQGALQLVGAPQIRRWLEQMATSRVEIKYVIKRQTWKEYEGEWMIFSRKLPWGGLGVAVQLLEADSQRADRKRYMTAGGAFMQFNSDGKIYRMRLNLGEKNEILDLGGGGD
jgi:hypothetical protein